MCGEMSKNIESPRDHPHVCGEKDALGMTFPAATPTCVGKRLKDIRKALHNPQIYSCPHSPSTFINTKEMIFVAQKKLIFIKTPPNRKGYRWSKFCQE